MPVIDNYDNNRPGAELSLSDLYGCKVPLQMKIVNGVQKTKKVDFASFEHAWCVRRMIRQPHVGTGRTVVTVTNMQQQFVTTQEDALCFLAQFEHAGVFASWSAINDYYTASQITNESKGAHNIGLIARFVCSNNPKADRIRSKIRGYAADRWKRCGDVVARSIACCLWRGLPNMKSYRSGLAVVARAKYDNNPEICNVLCMTRGVAFETFFDPCHMVTVTRKKSSTEYMHTLSRMALSSEWKLSSPLTLALVMAFHPRLGQDSLLAQINIDTFLSIAAPLVDVKQAKCIKKFFAKAVC
jgi:hypothetical protein